jgi:hypothetical protein
MRREDFVFCIGFEGSTAIVDGRMRSRYGSLSSAALAEEGLFKQAVCSALYNGRTEELEAILSIYNARTRHPVGSVEELKRTYGTFGVPEGVTRISII